MAARRRRIEWPMVDPVFISMLRAYGAPYNGNAVNPDAKAYAKQVIDFEISKCEISGPYSYDNGVIEEYCFNLGPRDPTADVLKALYYRARMQSTIWDVFTALVSRGFLSIESLRKPITLGTTSEAVAKLTWLLETFQYPSVELSPERSANPPHSFWEEFSAGEYFDWLSTMIVRGCADVPALFETIEASLFLGPQMEDKHRIYMEQCKDKTFVCNPDERLATQMITNPPFGFWLPHGIKGESPDEFARAIHESIARFNRIEKAFKWYFNVPDEILLTEDKQVQYFDQHPEELPAYLKKERAFPGTQS